MEKIIVSRNLAIAIAAAMMAAALVILAVLSAEQADRASISQTITDKTSQFATSPAEPGGAASSSDAASATGTASSSHPRMSIFTAPPPPFVIHVVTPLTKDAWQIGQPDSISWDRAANITGEIDLLNADNGTFVGVILSNAGPHQTSYSWDTRQVYLERYGSLKKDITPGTYLVRLKFDGNNLRNAIGGPVTISN